MTRQSARMAIPALSKAVLVSALAAGGSHLCQGAGTLARALEYHRHGNCAEAKPLLEHLVSQEPENKTIRRLLASCSGAAPTTGPARAGLPQARSGAQIPPKAAARKQGQKEAVSPKAGRKPVAVAVAGKPVASPSAISVAAAVLTRDDPRKVIHPNPPSVEARAAARTAPSLRTAAKRGTARKRTAGKAATKAPVPEVGSPFPLLPPGVAAIAPPAEYREREQAGSALFSAEKLIKTKQLDAAKKILLELTADKPDLALPRQRLAEIYSAKGMFSEAAAEYDWLAGREGSGEFRLRQAQNLSWAKRYQDAAVSYRDHSGLGRRLQRAYYPTE